MSANRDSRSAVSPTWHNVVSGAMVAVLMLWTMGWATGQDAAGNAFRRLDFAPTPGGVRLNLQFDGPIQHQLRSDLGVTMLYLDMLGARMNVSPVITPLATGPVRMVRLTTYSVHPPVVRATFFMATATVPVVRATPSGIELTFSGAPTGRDAGVDKTADQRRYSLIPPAAALTPRRAPESRPVNISVHEAQAADVLRQLAQQAGMALHLRDPLERPVTLDTVASSPLEAIRVIAAALDARVTVEDGAIWISASDNPLFRFSDTDMIHGVDLSGLALGDVLRALGKVGRINVVFDDSFGVLRDQRVDLVLSKMSYRRAFETVLRMYGLVARPTDATTLRIMTEAAARAATGNVMTVVPLRQHLPTVRDLLSSSVASSTMQRVIVKEKQGNMILIGDKQAVDEVKAQIGLVVGKLEHTADTNLRALYSPNNMKSDVLVPLVEKSLEKDAGLTFTIDQRTNSIMVVGPESAVQQALTSMRQFDHKPNGQALIRLQVMEVATSELNTLGLRLQSSETSVADLGHLPTQIAIPAALTYLRESSRVKNLANPSVRCMNGQEATIDITEQIPIKSTVTDYLPVASSSLAARTSDQWTTSETGIRMTVKPEIHPDMQISLNMDFDLTELLRLVEGHPWTAKRKAKTSIRVESGQTVILGGLVRRKEIDDHKKIPILDRIPILKPLLRALEHKQSDREETEIVILITPTVIDAAGKELAKSR